MPRPAYHALAAILVLWLATACSGPQPSAEEAGIDALARDSFYVDRTAHTGLVSYLHAGTAEVARIVFLHGASGNARDWADFLLAPTEGQAYVAVDRPGFGASRPEGAVLSLAAQSAALAPLLDPEADVPVVLVGHARGAAVALAAAARFPERVAGVVVLAGALDPSLADPHWLRTVAARPPVRWFLPRASVNAARERLAHPARLRELVPRLSSVRQPVRIIHGVNDTSAPFAHAAFLQQRLSRAPVTLLRLENAGHALPGRATAIVRAHINTLVAELCGGLADCRRGASNTGSAAGGEPHGS